MDPAALLLRGAKFLLQRFPKAERAVTDGQFRRNRQAASFQTGEQFAPGLSALAIARLEADQFLLAFRRGADQDKNALFVRSIRAWR